MNKNILTKIIINLLLLVFVVVWVLPTFGLFVSSFRDKDLLATSGWWTTFKTNEVNEIYRTKTFEGFPEIKIVGGGGYGAQLLPSLVCLDTDGLSKIGSTKIGTGRYVDCP